MTVSRAISLEMSADYAGQRLDRALALLLPEFTRSQLQQWIAGGQVKVDGRAPRKRDTVRGGERVDDGADRLLQYAHLPRPLLSSHLRDTRRETR